MRKEIYYADVSPKSNFKKASRTDITMFLKT